MAFFQVLNNSMKVWKEFVDAFIDFQKLIVVGINGPAVGAAVTILGLCDVIIASSKATFMTPFASLGLSPEGCSSHIFPKYATISLCIM